MDIMNTLKAERSLLEQIVELLKDEKQALIKNDIDEIQQIAAKKEELKVQVDEIEKHRIDICGSTKLKDMILQMNEKDKQEAEKIGSDMEKAVNEIQKANDVNGMLLKQSLDYVRMMVNVMNPPKVSVYNTKGRVESNRDNSGMLNTSI
jgi:flagellar biosynthesis/type III secretory pathway chaperone